MTFHNFRPWLLMKDRMFVGDCCYLYVLEMREEVAREDVGQCLTAVLFVSCRWPRPRPTSQLTDQMLNWLLSRRQVTQVWSKNMALNRIYSPVHSKNTTSTVYSMQQKLALHCLSMESELLFCGIHCMVVSTFVRVMFYIPSICLVALAIWDMCFRSVRVWCHIPCKHHPDRPKNTTGGELLWLSGGANNSRVKCHS